MIVHLPIPAPRNPPGFSHFPPHRFRKGHNHVRHSSSPLHTKVLERVTDELAESYRGTFSRETIERYVFESYTSLARTAKIKTYLPVLAQRFAKDRLRALAVAEGKLPTEVPQVLFVCVNNAGRSQIASALLNHYAGEKVEVRSAGSQPTLDVNPIVVEVLATRGIDITNAYPKPLTDDVVRASDYVITMGCGDVCPIYQGKHYLDWEISDPLEMNVKQVSEIIDDIEGRVRGLWETISKL